jgi:hypothetical protein
VGNGVVERSQVEVAYPMVATLELTPNLFLEGGIRLLPLPEEKDAIGPL